MVSILSPLADTQLMYTCTQSLTAGVTDVIAICVSGLFLFQLPEKALSPTMPFCSQLPSRSSPVSVKWSLLALNHAITEGTNMDTNHGYKSKTACFQNHNEEVQLICSSLLKPESCHTCQNSELNLPNAQIEHDFLSTGSKLHVKWQLKEANPNDYRTPWWGFTFKLIWLFREKT